MEGVDRRGGGEREKVLHTALGACRGSAHFSCFMTFPLLFLLLLILVRQFRIGNWGRGDGAGREWLKEVLVRTRAERECVSTLWPLAACIRDLSIQMILHVLRTYIHNANKRRSP